MENGIKIKLTKKEIDAFFKDRDLARWKKDVEVYAFLREKLSEADTTPEYKRRFNYFYQVRRNSAWREKFYALYFKHAKKGSTDFGKVLNALFIETGKVEASFASKFTATIDPSLPIIDRHVLSYIDRKLPPNGWSKEKRIAHIIELHKEMKQEFELFLKNTAPGRHLVARVSKQDGDKGISTMKMLDFVLWQSGGKKKKPR